MFTLVSSSKAVRLDRGVAGAEEMMEASRPFVRAWEQHYVERLAAAEAVIRAASCEHEHWSVDAIERHSASGASSYSSWGDCAEAGCEEFCARCAWLRDA